MKNKYHSIIQRLKPVCQSMAYRFLFFIILSIPNLAIGQSLQLPFFDDFSNQQLTQGNPKLWLQSGGTIQNFTVAINPPTMGVITFDGKNASGIPYDFNSKTSNGLTDVLTSMPIDLSKYSPKDSLILSFYWQAKGLGELPDEEDSLKLSMLNKKGEWKTAWVQKGGFGLNTTQFKQAFVTLSDSAFFYENFKFKFEAYGRQTGSFDNWNLDLVYFNAHRAIAKIDFEERACQALTGTYLKNFSAMPLNQYLVNPKAETNESLTVQAFNFNNSLSNTNFTISYIDNSTQKSIKKVESTELKDFMRFNAYSTYFQKFPIEVLSPLPSKKVDLSVQFKLISVENGNVINSTANDSISHRVVLNNYYAYDDGTAELGADVDIKLAKVAIRFPLNQPDILTAVQVNFSPYYKNQEGQYFFVQIYKDSTIQVNGKNASMPGKLIYQEEFKVVNPSKANEFTTYSLREDIKVEKGFYVGWTKVSNETIGVGFDKNTPQFAHNIYYNLGGSNWVQNDSTNMRGSLMVRAIMGADTTKKPVITAIEPTIKDTDFVIFPNPASNQINWNTKLALDVKVFNLAGNLILDKICEDNTLDLSTLSTGYYVIHFKNGASTVTRKLIIYK